MRTLEKNKRKMFYSLYTGSTEQIATNPDGSIQYVIVDGEAVPVEVGTVTNGYTLPETMRANIAFGGDSDVQSYGINIGDYDAVIVTDKNKYPIVESSLIWYETEPTYLDNEHTIVDPKSADYTVRAVLQPLNSTKIVLKRRVKKNED